jgi:hypothetical protein
MRVTVDDDVMGLKHNRVKTAEIFGLEKEALKKVQGLKYT